MQRSDGSTHHVAASRRPLSRSAVPIREAESRHEYTCDRSSHANIRLDASHIGNPKRASTEAPGSQGSCRVRSTRRAAPAHLSTQYPTLLSRSLINVDVAGSNKSGCSIGTKGAVRSKKMEVRGKDGGCSKCFAIAKRPYFRRFRLFIQRQDGA